MHLNKELLEIPTIKNKFKIKNLERFFYEYALYKKIDIKQFDISQEELNLELNTIYNKNFIKEILDTIEIEDPKNYFVILKKYNLKKKIKVSEEIFNLIKYKKNASGKIKLEFDKIRDFFYISMFEEWSFELTLNTYTKQSNNKNFKMILEAFGYNDHNLIFREKICILARLLPLVHKNLNIMEITKPQVGKSYIYDELMTKNTIVKKLKDLTSANLFATINSTNNEEAILKSCSVLCIDEFHKGSFKDIAAGLQTFMENGKVSRGKESYYSDTSIIMFANFKEENMYKKFFINPKEFNPFKNIPEIDDAFLQRINYINPSFGMRALQPNLFINKTTPRVPISIYEKLFEELRCLDFDFKEIFPNLKILQEDNIESEVRISTSIIQVANAFFKLLFPNKIEQITLDRKDDSLFEIKVCFYLAMEGYSILNALKNKPTNLYVSLDNKNNSHLIYLGEFNLYKEIIEYFLDTTNLFNSFLFPHRYLKYSRDNYGNMYFKRVPLDTIGIEQNLNEFNIYNTLIPNNISANNFLSNSMKTLNINLKNVDYNTSNTETICLDNLKVNKYFVRLRELYKNYLYGYKINSSGYMDFIGNLGNCIITSKNKVICPNCKREIILNFGSDNSPTNGVNLLKEIICESCKKEIYNYDLFPEFFKDYLR